MEIYLLVGLCRGHSNMICASFSAALEEKKGHSQASLEIGIIVRRPVSMTSLWFEVR